MDNKSTPIKTITTPNNSSFDKLIWNIKHKRIVVIIPEEFWIGEDIDSSKNYKPLYPIIIEAI